MSATALATVRSSRVAKTLRSSVVPLRDRTTRPDSAPHRADRAPAPFVKWVGGKSKLMSQLAPLLPPAVERMRHVEPFAGGGAMFFTRAPERALLADINAPLVDAYLAIRDEVGAVIQALTPLSTLHAEGRYYAVRERYNTASKLTRAERTAMFIYLNKTCFNGLHRVNRKGEFNVPQGRYKNPRILDVEGLLAASAALRSATIRKAGFEEMLSLAKPGDFVYFDPPYEPVSRTSNFTSYAEGGFTQEDQERLRDVYSELDRRGCKLMLSNSDVPFVRSLYTRFRVDVVKASRAVNCQARGRGPVNEVVVRNY